MCARCWDRQRFPFLRDVKLNNGKQSEVLFDCNAIQTCTSTTSHLVKHGFHRRRDQLMDFDKDVKYRSVTVNPSLHSSI